MDWVNEVQKPALATAEDPKFSQWHRCQGTWFVGVNVLGNDAAGRVQGGAAFRGAVKYFLDRHLAFGTNGFDAGQVSIIIRATPSRAKENRKPPLRFGATATRLMWMGYTPAALMPRDIKTNFRPFCSECRSRWLMSGPLLWLSGRARIGSWRNFIARLLTILLPMTGQRLI